MGEGRGGRREGGGGGRGRLGGGHLPVHQVSSVTAESLLGTQQCVLEEILIMSLLIANSLLSIA